MPWRSLARARVAVWPVFELLMTVGVQIVLTPLLLHRLGMQQFGVWVLIQSLLLTSAALSLGASAGALPVLSVVLHRGDGAAVHAALRWLFRRVAVVSLIVLVAVAVVIAAGWFPGGLLGPTQGQLWPLALATLAWMTVTELDNTAGAALKAHGRFEVAAQTESVGRIVLLGLMAACVSAGSMALVPVAIALVVTLAKLGLRLRALHRHSSATSAAPAPAAVTTATRELAITGAWIWAGALGSLAFNAFDRWFVGAWFGSSVLAAYAVCTQLAQLPHAVVSAASQVLVPWSARHASAGTHEPERRPALKVLIAATALAALPSLVLLPLLEPLLSLWISEAFAREHLRLAQGLTLAFLLLSLNAPGYFLLQGMGQARLCTTVIGACGVVFVLGALALPRHLTTFVLLKAVFAALALILPIACAMRLRAAPPAS